MVSLVTLMVTWSLSGRDCGTRTPPPPVSGQPPLMAGIKDCFVLKEGDTPFFREWKVTSVERKLMDPHHPSPQSG